MNRLHSSLLGAFVAFGLAFSGQVPAATNVPASAVQTLPDFADLVEKFGPAVVNINTQTRTQRTAVPGLSEDDPFYEFFRRFMPPTPSATRAATAAKRARRARRAKEPRAVRFVPSASVRDSSFPRTATSSPTRTSSRTPRRSPCASPTSASSRPR